MEYHANDWLGRWQNFEAYLTSSDPYLTRAWQDAETAAAAMPMFCGGVKVFWQRACVTTSPENPHTLGGWNITLAVGEKLCIEWLDEDGASLGKAVYHLESVLEKGLEGKENALFVAEDMPENWPFRCLLAMEPMPPRPARQNSQPAAQSQSAEQGRGANNGQRGRQNASRNAQPAPARAPRAESSRRGRATAARDEDPGLMLISRRPPQQKFTNFEEYMNAHGGATAPIEDHSDEV